MWFGWQDHRDAGAAVVTAEFVVRVAVAVAIIARIVVMIVGTGVVTAEFVVRIAGALA
jgi:hypothetical protein